MIEAIHDSSKDLTEKEKEMLLWASFLALMAAGVGFVLRSLIGTNLWGSYFEVSSAAAAEADDPVLIRHIASARFTDNVN